MEALAPEVVESLDLKKSLSEPVPQMSFERKAEGAIIHRNLVLHANKGKELEAQFQAWMRGVATDLGLADNEYVVNLDTFELQKNQ